MAVVSIIAGSLLMLVLAVLLALRFWPGVGRPPGRQMREAYARRTSLYHEGRFHNEKPAPLMTGRPAKPDGRVKPKGTLKALHESLPPKGRKGGLSLIWYGHSTVHIQLGTSNILLDPVLSERTSPVSFAGPRRFSEMALRAEDLPQIDVVFLSHDHYDHLDYASIRRIDARVSHYVLPLGVDSYLRGWGVDPEKLHPLAWWESIRIGDVVYTLIPGRHFGGRHPLHPNAALWGGVHMDDGTHTVCFTGDTGYHEGFSQVFERLGAVDLLLSDSAQYDPAWANSHMTPRQAVQAAKDMRAVWLIPVHWGAFVLAGHAWDAPPALACEAAAQLGVKVAFPRLGQVLGAERIGEFTGHWWERAEGRNGGAS